MLKICIQFLYSYSYIHVIHFCASVLVISFSLTFCLSLLELILTYLGLCEFVTIGNSFPNCPKHRYPLFLTHMWSSSLIQLLYYRLASLGFLPRNHTFLFSLCYSIFSGSCVFPVLIPAPPPTLMEPEKGSIVESLKMFQFSCLIDSLRARF